MRIESVSAHAFGPLAGQTLTLAPGMTVVTGVNESAKSSWHAALYAALVGRRRGKGAPTRDERRFTELHKPWDSPDWRVSAVIALDDGRRIELNQDLGGKVDCRAMDLTVGSDVSNEIMFEGSPDASRYLGLDRKSFAATAVVNQAELLTILSVADGLQEHLQRAASTAGTDATAAAALATLESFLRDNVGLDRSNSTRPLRAAKDGLAQAEVEMAAVRVEHEDYLLLVATAEEHHEAAAAATADVSGREATVLALEALLAAAREAAEAQTAAEQAVGKANARAGEVTTLARRVDRAGDLDTRFGGQAPTGLGGADETSRAVAAALATWASTPGPVALSGPTSQDLRTRLDALPKTLDGDTGVAPVVRAAADQLAQAQAVVAAHTETAPPTPGDIAPDVTAALTAGTAVVRDLAAQLAAVTPNVATLGDESSTRVQVDHAQSRLAAAATGLGVAEENHAEAQSPYVTATTPTAPPASQPAGGSNRRPALIGVATVAAVTAVALFVLGQVAPAAVAAVLAAAAGVAAFVIKAPHAAPAVPGPVRPDQQPGSVAAQQAATRLQEARVEHLDASRAVAELEGRLTAEAAAKRSSTAACADVEARCAARNLPADTASLQRLAAVAEQVSEQRTTYLRWSRTHEAYAGDVAHATERLQSQLAARGEPLDPSVSVEAALAAYTAACADRAEQAAAASRRPALTQALADRLTAEDAAVAATAALKRAITGLRSATRAAGAPVAEDAPETDVVAALEQWQVTYADRVATADAHQHDWAELQAVLDGATLADLELELRRLRDDNAELAEVAARAEAAATAALERAQSAAAAAGVDPLSGSDVDSATKLVSDARQDLASARTEALGLSGFAENSGGVAAERARALRSVPEAEEAVAAARAELDRVTELASTLAMTQQFLTAAQERVHRDIAPVLADTLRAWLPAVTGGRYVDATVNPATLEVKVCGPRRNWREADRLSIGTAEQVYLLLRVALAQHLTTTGEKCPLLLDDVTVQADDDRTREVLDLLLRLSADRQVVLFAQEPIVAEWAQEHLDGYAEHSMVELSQIDVG